MIDWSENMAFRINNINEYNFLKKLIFDIFGEDKIKDYSINDSNWIYYDEDWQQDSHKKDFWYDPIGTDMEEDYYKIINIKQLLRENKLNKIINLTNKINNILP